MVEEKFRGSKFVDGEFTVEYLEWKAERAQQRWFKAIVDHQEEYGW